MKKSVNHKQIFAIIPAAGKPSNLIIQHSTLPDTMLPINGKPVIGYILEDLLSRGIKNAVIALHPADSHTQKYVEQKFTDKMGIKFIRTNPDRGVGNSIHLASKLVEKNNTILLYLGDTIYKGKLNFGNDFLVISNRYENPEKWCFIEKHHNRNFLFINKPAEYKLGGKVLCGVYYFKDYKNFILATNRAVNKNKKVEISHILEAYQKFHKFDLISANRWYDCGNIENYYQAKVDFLRTRSFNRLSYNPQFGIITKTGTNIQKINQEINWYLNTPDPLKIFSPRLFDYKIGKKMSYYSIEYYGYPTLADIHMFAYINQSVWQSIINRLLEITELFKGYPNHLPRSYFSDMYEKKVVLRLNDLQKHFYWKKVLNRSTISINGVEHKNISYFLNKFEEMTGLLYEKKDMSFIHGDFCMGNILYDVNSKLLKFLDPRGYFGKMSIYGDIKYDIAKLRHSFCSFYDFIVADLFKIIEPAEGQYFYNVYIDDYHRLIANKFDEVLIKKGYNLKLIKYVEALLFLSMASLHSNSLSRQKAMYVTGIRLLNETFK